MTPTPETLRKLAKYLDTMTPKSIYAHADAWETEQQHNADVGNRLCCIIDALREKLAVSEQARQRAEEALRKYGDHMTYCKGNMDAPCTCGYHDVCKPAVKRMEGRQAWLDDAALAQTKEAGCLCGHAWSAHNEHGCCWDDECLCEAPSPKESAP